VPVTDGGAGDFVVAAVLVTDSVGTIVLEPVFVCCAVCEIEVDADGVLDSDLDDDGVWLAVPELVWDGGDEGLEDLDRELDRDGEDVCVRCAAQAGARAGHEWKGSTDAER